MVTIRIKNMVCPRCIAAVESKLTEIGFPPVSVELGKAILEHDISTEDKKSIGIALSSLGFELLDDSQTVTIEEIKQNIIAWVRLNGERIVLSEYLQDKMRREYSVLSKMFSEIRGITIERYSILMRIEYAKELLSYEQMTVSEIAYHMGYSSAAHLSMQFKKETGMSPSQFRSGKDVIKRKSLDSI